MQKRTKRYNYRIFLLNTYMNNNKLRLIILKCKPLKTAFIRITAIMLFIICGVTECMADVNTSAFLHKKDVIELNNNSIEFTYWDGCDHKIKTKNYTISSDWCSAMIIWGEDLTGTIGTNTTIYGPYTWLPAGDYRVSFKLTSYGWNILKYWDIGVNFGQQNTGYRNKYDRSNCQINADTTVSNIVCGGNDTGGNLDYTIHTNGDSADYELRTYFSRDADLGIGGPEHELSKIGHFIREITICSLDSNTIYYDADGGLLDKEETGKLTDTNWGADRGNVSIPAKEGYIFEGWYGYSKASNTTSNRDKLTFDTDSEYVMLWDSNGKPCSSVLKEASYSDYTVYAKWKPKDKVIKYISNAPSGVSNMPQDINTMYGSEVSLSGQRPSRKLFKFDGWNTEADGSGDMYYPLEAVTELTKLSEDTVNLYAQWQRQRFMYIKAASTTYGDTFIKRTPDDELWYTGIGSNTIHSLPDSMYSWQVQKWYIDKNGSIYKDNYINV